MGLRKTGAFLETKDIFPSEIAGLYRGFWFIIGSLVFAIVGPKDTLKLGLKREYHFGGLYAL